MECKRHIQKGKCRQGTHTGLKHARWPATTCGFNPSAYGKVPHVVAERDLHGWGRMRCQESQKVDQKGAQRRKKKTKMKPKGTKRVPKGTQRVPKGSQRMPKGSGRATKMDPKIALGAKVDFGSKKEVSPESFWEPFLINFPPKSRSKIDAKTDVEKT